MTGEPPLLTLSPQEMRELGYRIIDRLVEHQVTLGDQPATGRGTRAELEALLREPIPEAGRPVTDVLQRLEADVLPYMMHVDHPRFFAFVPGPSNFVSVMADTLATGLNVFQGTWLASSGPSQVELVTVDWLREICGLPASAGGHFVSGGSMANLTALAVARHVRGVTGDPRAVIYLSDQTHSSVTRALRVLGFHEEQVVALPPDDRFRLDLRRLEEAMDGDLARGRRPFCVVASAGTTNTGAVDPLPELAEICARRDLWLHADGAYGAAAAISAEGGSALPGLGGVHSLSLDPHKWLFQPFEIGCVLVREAGWLRDTLHTHPEYMRDTRVEGEEINFAEQSIQLTRTFRALKLWMSLQVFGRGAFAAAVDRGLQLARFAEAELRSMAGWEVVTPAQLGIVSFRRLLPAAAPEELDTHNSRLVEMLFRDGSAMLSSTRLRGVTALRMCTINPRTTEEDIRRTLTTLERLGTRLEEVRNPPNQRAEER